jgi:sn-glycerol 3-phosphate transport system substrate-binding protein
MMRPRDHRSFVLASLWLLLCVTACGGGAPASTTAPSGGGTPAASTGNIELSFYYPVAVPGPITQIIDGYVADFQKANPTISVKPVLAGSYQDTLTKIQTTIQGGGDPPEVAVLLSTDLYPLVDADAVIPLDDLIKSSGGDAYLKDFYPAFMSNSQYQGKTYGIPFQRSTPVLYYNKDLFKAAGLDPEKPPKTWQEMADDAAKLTKKDASGNVAQWGLEIPSDGFPYWLFQAFAISNGQNVVGDDPSKVFFNTPTTVEGLQYVLDLSKKYKAMPEGVILWANVPNDFTGGKTAMAYHTTGSLTSVLKSANFPVGLGFLPGNKKPGGAPTGGGNLYIFKKVSPEKQQAAWKFIQFLTTPERAAQWSIDTGYVATRKSAYDTPVLKDFVAKNPQYGVARDQLQYAERELATHNSPQIQQIFGNGIQAAITGKKTPQQALDDAQKEAERVLAQFKP